MNADSRISQYVGEVSLRSVKIDRTTFVQSMGAHRQNQIHVDEVVGSLLQNLVISQKGGKWLEIGTLAGYSTAIVAKQLARFGGHITTVEKNFEMVELARENLKKAMVPTDVFDVIHSEGLTYVKNNAEKKWDGIFLDANKASYREYVRLLKKQLKIGATLIVDNVFLNGELTSALDEGTKGHWTKASKMQMLAMVDDCVNDNDFVTTLLPLHDGVLLVNKVTEDEIG